MTIDDATLRAIFDTVIPADEWPGGWDGSARGGQREHADGLIQAVGLLARLLDEEAGGSFAGLPSLRRLEVMTAVASTSEGGVAVAAAVALIDTAFYASGHGWAMTGFDPGPTSDAIRPVPTGILPADLADEYDVVVIGAGAGGGVVAAERAARGDRVLLLERSRPMSADELRSDHLRGKRMQVRDVTAGAGAGSPRVFEHADGVTRMLPGEGDGVEYGLNAMTLGGGTRLWQGMSWRFYDEDFRMASTYGVPDGSSLSDWPIGYADLAPNYSRVEHEHGVSGDATSAL
jgi:hypothetical protein